LGYAGTDRKAGKEVTGPCSNPCRNVGSFERFWQHGWERSPSQRVPGSRRAQACGCGRKFPAHNLNFKGTLRHPMVDLKSESVKVSCQEAERVRSEASGGDFGDEPLLNCDTHDDAGHDRSRIGRLAHAGRSSEEVLNGGTLV
jgi:hypothetical protein